MSNLRTFAVSEIRPTHDQNLIIIILVIVLLVLACVYFARRI